MKKEAIYNCYYEHTEIEGIPTIFALGIKHHIKSGSDEEKMQFLLDNCEEDFKTAKHALLSKRFSVGFCDGKEGIKGILPIEGFHSFDYSHKIDLFEELFACLEKEYKIKVAREPMLCITGVTRSHVEGKISAGYKIDNQKPVEYVV